MALTQTTDHATEAIDLLLEQLKGKPVIEALLTTLVEPMNAIEDALFQLLTQRVVIAETEGVQLTALADLLGRARQGVGDAQLRAQIQTEILLHSCTGTIDSLIELTAGRVHFLESYLGGQDAELEILHRNSTTGLTLPDSGLDSSTAAEIYRVLNAGVSAGVYFVFLWGTPLVGAEIAGRGFGFDGRGGFDASPGTFGFFRINALAATAEV